MNKEKKELILKFIKNELLTEPFPIYADISRKIFEIYDEHILPCDISKICAKICAENSINKSTPIHPISAQKREYLKNCEIANASGISDEEVYILRLKGYSYSSMSRVFFEMNDKLLSSQYFSEKYRRYCVLHKIKPQTKVIKSNEVLAEIQELEKNNTEHSAFYNRMLTEKSGYSRDKRIKAISELHDPIKKLKHFDYDDHDER